MNSAHAPRGARTHEVAPILGALVYVLNSNKITNMCSYVVAELALFRHTGILEVCYFHVAICKLQLHPWRAAYLGHSRHPVAAARHGFTSFPALVDC